MQQYRGFALTPFTSQVPEASSLLMAVSSLGVIGWLGRRRLAQRQAV
jgi:hypothetical protein